MSGLPVAASLSAEQAGFLWIKPKKVTGAGLTSHDRQQ